MGKILLFGFFSLFGLASSTSAEDDAYSHQLWGYVGFDGGFSLLDTDFDDELNKTGFHLAPKALLSYAWEYAEVGVGVGWFYNRMSGTSSGPLLKDQVSTRSFFSELAARYRLSHSWSFGPLMQLSFGSDAGFGTNDTSKTNPLFLLGPQISYRFDHNWPIRVTAQYATDLNISSRQIHLFSLGVHLGLRLHRGTREEADSPRPETFRHSQPKGQVKLGRFHFNFETYQLSSEDEAHIKILARYLAERKNQWGRILIRGHTDRIGPREVNLLISEGRARSVERIFVRAGIAEEAIQREALAFDEPLSEGLSISDHQRNRRVEIFVLKASHPERLQREIDQMR